jgi:hypothetical protein
MVDGMEFSKGVIAVAFNFVEVRQEILDSNDRVTRLRGSL